MRMMTTTSQWSSMSSPPMGEAYAVSEWSTVKTMCAFKYAFAQYHADRGSRTEPIAKSGATLYVRSTGTLWIRMMMIGAGVESARLDNPLHVKDLRRYMFIIIAVLLKVMRVSIDCNRCKTKRKGTVVDTSTNRGSLICVDVVCNAECQMAANIFSVTQKQSVKLVKEFG